MSDTALTVEQYRRLIQELGSNDSFRQKYSEKPAAALAEFGIPLETIVHLKASCLVPHSLAAKEIFQAAYRRLDDKAVQHYASMTRPTVTIESKN